MHDCETRVRVRYAETDQMGVVYHANYLIWMEIGRVEWCRSRGASYRDMEAEGILLAVAEVNCRYLAPARYDEVVSIRTRVAEAGRRLVRFEYQIACGERALAAGFTKHVFLDRALRRSALPARYYSLFGI
jgi:acyl-CoA thioester hydrolase